MTPKSKVTLDDIASRAGVSLAAVSQTLSGKGRISDATRERILQVVEELSYKPDQTAQNLALRRASQASGKRLKTTRDRRIPPQGMMVFYDLPELTEVVHLEIQQMEEEGYEVAQYRQALDSLKKPSKNRLYRLYSDVLSAPSCPGFDFQEPEELEEIRAARPAGPRDAHFTVTSQELYERIYGAWLGRAAGCVLGMPLQAGWSKSQVIQYLQMAESYPLQGYIPRLIPLPPGLEFRHQVKGCFRGEVHGAPPDDDTDFTILSLHILEHYGLGFKTADVATEWLEHIPYFNTHTTERAVYRNLIWNIHPEDAATFANPEREFIGGKTRADLYGYIAPGKPQLAAALAYRDASLSHAKNGVYSAMLAAAMIAWSFVSNDLTEIVQVGLSEIPQHCRLAAAIRDALEAYQRFPEWDLAYNHLLLQYGSYSPIHTINNTLWVVLSLLYSRGDFNRALGTAVACGMDTSSNAASTGSVMGLIYTQSRIPGHWTEPLHDTLHTALAQFPETRISELAARTARIAENTLFKTS